MVELEVGQEIKSMGLPRPLSISDIKLMEIPCRIVSDTLTHISKYIKHGIETKELDRIAEDFIKTRNAEPAFKNYNNFPSTLCISIDEEVVHGLPSERKLVEGQIVSIDCGAKCNGFVGDSAVTFPVGNISDEKKKLLKVTEEALLLGIAQAVDKAKIYDISYAIQTHCEKNGYSLTRELTGHGIGRKLHMEPAIPNFVPSLLQKKIIPNKKLINGLGLAIEPMVHLGLKETYLAKDKITVITRDGSPAAHFEHTIIVNGQSPIILTLRN